MHTSWQRPHMMGDGSLSRIDPLASLNPVALGIASVYILRSVSRLSQRIWLLAFFDVPAAGLYSFFFFSFYSSSFLLSLVALALLPSKAGSLGFHFSSLLFSASSSSWSSLIVCSGVGRCFWQGLQLARSYVVHKPLPGGFRVHALALPPAATVEQEQKNKEEQRQRQ